MRHFTAVKYYMAVTNRLVRETPVRLVRNTCTAHEGHLHGSQGTLARLGQPSRPSFFKTSTIKKQVKKQKMLAYFKQKHYFCPRIRQKDTPDL